MNRTPHHHPLRLRRSVLSVPAVNPRALAKSASLDCDAIIFDLEDSVLPEKKAEARAALVAHFSTLDRSSGREHVIRINPLDGPDGALDLEAVLDCMPDAVLLPKVSEPQDVLTVADWLSEAGADDGPRLWAMIEDKGAGVYEVVLGGDANRNHQAFEDKFKTIVQSLSGKDSRAQDI